MNPSPFSADSFQRGGNRGADLHYVDPAKSCLIDQPNRSVWAVQLQFGAPAPWPDGMDMRRRMIIGVYRHADVSDGEDGRHVKQ